MFEWADNNEQKEDRRGLFVSLNGTKISLASNINEVLGIVSADPSVCGDVQDDQWKGMYLYDIFGTPIYEEYNEEYDTDEIDENGEKVKAIRKQKRQKLNPDYDPNVVYIPRSERPEWDAVGLLGKLVMVDDGSASVGAYVQPALDGSGKATAADSVTKFYVMERLDENHIRVLIK